MTRVVLPCGFVYHEPPYTEEEIEDLYRRTANIVGFTRPVGRRADPTPGVGDEPAAPPDTTGREDPSRSPP